MKTKIGYDLEYMPKDTCTAVNCPYHGKLSIRGKIFEGKVESDLMQNSVKISFEIIEKNLKYSRYLKKRSSVIAHNPDCISAKKNDVVLIAETRPLSKTKHFTVLKVISDESN